jgi:hypothetical protein
LDSSLTWQDVDVHSSCGLLVSGSHNASLHWLLQRPMDLGFVGALVPASNRTARPLKKLALASQYDLQVGQHFSTREITLQEIL